MISCMQMEELFRAMPLNSIPLLRSPLIPFRRLRNPLPSFPSHSSTTGTSAKKSGVKLAANSWKEWSNINCCEYLLSSFEYEFVLVAFFGNEVVMKLNIAHRSRRLCSSSPSSLCFKGIWQGCLAAWDFPTLGGPIIINCIARYRFAFSSKGSLS